MPLYFLTLNTVLQNLQKDCILVLQDLRGMRYKFIRNYNSFEVYESNLGNNTGLFLKKEWASISKRTGFLPC